MSRGGKREGAGRKPGSENKITASVKDAILSAFEEVGGEKYLVTVARDNPAVFCALLGKLLPKQVTGEDGAAIRIAIVTDEVSDEEWSRRYG